MKYFRLHSFSLLALCQFTRLEKLSLIANRVITHSGYQSLTNLTSLNLRNCGGTTVLANAVLASIARLVKLRFLELSGYSMKEMAVTEAEAEAVVTSEIPFDGHRANYFANLTNLTELDLGSFYHPDIGMRPCSNLLRLSVRVDSTDSNNLNLLRLFRLMDIDPDDAQPVLPSYVTTLSSLRFGPFTCWDPRYELILTQMTNLTYFDFSSNRWTEECYDWVPHLTKLVRLDLRYGCRLPDKILRVHTQLTSLSLVRNRAISDESLTCLTNLTSLFLVDGSERVTDSALIRLAGSLTALSLSRNPHITDDCVKQLTNLRILALRYNELITEASVGHLTNLTLLGMKRL